MTGLASYLATLVIGGLFALWLRNFIDRPKLEVVGGGAGQSHYFTFRLAPAFIGIKLGHTRIFGKNVHGQVRWGRRYRPTNRPTMPSVPLRCRSGAARAGRTLLGA